MKELTREQYDKWVQDCINRMEVRTQAECLENRSNEPENIQMHRRLLQEMHELYCMKNADYGDSFHLSFEEEGLAMARIRLGDKFNRFKTLSRSETAMVQDESIVDTLIDLANYAVMTVMEMERKK
jgi:hypothetical protein